MRKVKTFKKSWLHELDIEINEWVEKRNVQIVSSSVSQAGSGEYMAMITYEPKLDLLP